MLKLKTRPPFYGRNINRFVTHLNRRWPVEPNISLEILQDCEMGAFDLEMKGVDNPPVALALYGVYNWETGEILIAAGEFWPNFPAMILIYIGHEYYHVLQNLKHAKFDERQADVFTLREVSLYIQSEEE
jgi:hypothetical protein